jgi:hypothetical protein
MQTDFVLDALEQALYARRTEREGDLVHHSDRGSQYVSIRYSERLAQAGIESSVGSTGDSYDKGYVSHCTSFARSRSSAPPREFGALRLAWCIIAQGLVQGLVFVVVGMAPQQAAAQPDLHRVGRDLQHVGHLLHCQHPTLAQAVKAWLEAIRARQTRHELGMEGCAKTRRCAFR